MPRYTCSVHGVDGCTVYCYSGPNLQAVEDFLHHHDHEGSVVVLAIDPQARPAGWLVCDDVPQLRDEAVYQYLEAHR